VVAARFTVRLKSLGEAHRFAKRSAIPNAPVINRLMKLKYPALRQNVRTRLRRALLPCPSAALGEATKAKRPSLTRAPTLDALLYRP